MLEGDLTHLRVEQTVEIDAELVEQTDASGARAGGRSRGAPPWGAWGMPPRALRCADGSEVWAKAGDLATAHPQLDDTLKQRGAAGSSVPRQRGWCGSPASITMYACAGRRSRRVHQPRRPTPSTLGLATRRPRARASPPPAPSPAPWTRPPTRRHHRHHHHRHSSSSSSSSRTPT
jgi:hypothetical protein